MGKAKGRRFLQKSGIIDPEKFASLINSSPGFPFSKRSSKVEGDAVTTRVMIADGHELSRAALRKLIERESNMEVVGEAVDGREVLTQVEKLQPDVLLLDLSMPQLSGWNVLRRLAKSTIDVRVILLPATIEGDQAVEALRLGARGLLPKSTASQLLYKSIRTVMAGDYWVDHGTVRELVNIYRTSAESASKAAQIAKYNLTRRELEILSSVVDGCTNKDIATQFKISEQTVKHHLTSIFEKVGVSNRLELALFAMNQNLVA
jgi:two-component system, NarL family, nitrate/nitrite response regulator NarL